MKQALLIVNFGTSVQKAQGAIARVEEALTAAAEGMPVYRAITSPTIRAILRRRGQEAQSLEEVLEALAGEGLDRLIVQPTYLLGGIEYDKVRSTVAAFAPRFPEILLGKPLLSDTEAVRALADCLVRQFADETAALAMMGHGTEHEANLVYPALQTALRLAGGSRAYVGTVEGWPTIDEVIGELKAAGEREVLLVPLMLVAGNHALEDMAGDSPDSWKSRLEAEGFLVRCRMEGLGELPEVQELYCRRLQEIMQK